mgnify:CR=1 FL=1
MTRMFRTAALGLAGLLAAAPASALDLTKKRENLPDLVNRVHDALAARPGGFELICVDDGSKSSVSSMALGMRDRSATISARKFHARPAR